MKDKELLKENFYRNLATTAQISGLSLCSFSGFFIKDFIFGLDVSNTKEGLVIACFLIGIMFLVGSVQLSLVIDRDKNLKKVRSK